MSTEERALLAAIVANPDDDTPRLVYADWLDEHADSLPARRRASARARAELIRVQVEEGNLILVGKSGGDRYEELSERADALIEKYEKAWLAELGGVTFPATIDARAWTRSGPPRTNGCATVPQSAAKMRRLRIPRTLRRRAATRHLRSRLPGLLPECGRPCFSADRRRLPLGDLPRGRVAVQSWGADRYEHAATA